MGLRGWFRKRPSSAALREELEAHIALRAGHDGIDESAARKRLGNVLHTQEEIRRVWIAEFWDTLAQDASFTWRSWNRNRGFALAAVGVLALGLGGATALFGALDRILFRDVPYPNPGRLVSVGLMTPLDANEIMLDGDYVQLWKPAPEPFESVTTFTAGSVVCDLTEENPERLGCLYVEASLLRVLGVAVLAGRDFTAADDAPGAPQVAIIRHELWMRRFGGDPNAIGKTLRIDDKPVPVVGILPAGFELPNLGDSEVLLPQQVAPFNANFTNRTRILRAYGRLKPGVTPQQAQAALQPVLAQMLLNIPAQFRSAVSLRIRTLHERQMGEAQRTAWLLMGAAGVLLLIACVNVVNLLLARLAARQQEFAIRAALGAGRGRLARLALTESILLSLVGCALGLPIAAGLLKIFVAIAPGGIPAMEKAALDPRVVGLAVAMAVGVGIAMGLWPAAAMMRSRALHGARTTNGVRAWARFGLVTAQIALTVGLLGISTLFLRSLWNVAATPLGFETQNVLVAPVTLNAAYYKTPEQRQAFFEQLIDRANKLPGAISAAISDATVLGGGTDGMMYANINVEGRPLPTEGTGGMISWRSVTPRFFETLRVPIVHGRTFQDSDQLPAEKGMIINETLAQKMFPGEEPLGRRVAPGRGALHWFTVVGVAKDMRDTTGQAVEPEYFLAEPGGTVPGRRSAFLIVRTAVNPVAAAGLLKEAIRTLDPRLPVTIQTMSQRAAALADRPRFIAWLLAAFAALALLLAASGLYGVASYLVAQRNRDIGIRIALGARQAQVARQVIAEASRWILAGAVVGCVLAWSGTRALDSQLQGVSARDPLSWGVSVVALAIVLLLAVVRPAARAARVDPMRALRAE